MSAVDDSIEFGQLENYRVLYRTVSTCPQLVLIYTGDLRKLVFEDFHALMIAGNMGIKRTVAALLERFWWSRIFFDAK